MVNGVPCFEVHRPFQRLVHEVDNIDENAPVSGPPGANPYNADERSGASTNR